MSDFKKASLATRASSALAGTYRDIEQVNNLLIEAAKQAHLISPATSIGRLPEGCSVALTAVTVDLATDDTYNVNGKRGLSKTVLNKLASALGISWDPYASRRLDDGSDPYYCRWQAVGQYRAFDGQIQTIQAAKEMDLRDRSPTVQGLIESAQQNNKNPNKVIREMRQHIQSHAETRALLRAIRSLGVKTAYTAEELAKPFVAARVVFTGETDDPVKSRMFAEKIADSFLGGTRALYGASAAAAHQSAAITQQLSAPPPVGSVRDDDDEDEHIDAHGEEVSRPAAAASATSAPQKTEQAPAQTQERAQTGRVFKIPKKGIPISEATDKDLEFWLHSNIAERDGEFRAAIEAEIDRRRAEGVY